MSSALPLRTQFRLVVFAVMLVGFGIGVLAVQLQSLALSLVFLGWVPIASFLIYQVKCPNCGTSATYMGKFLGMRMWGAIVAQTKCSACGYDFTARRAL